MFLDRETPPSRYGVRSRLEDMPQELEALCRLGCWREAVEESLHRAVRVQLAGPTGLLSESLRVVFFLSMGNDGQAFARASRLGVEPRDFWEWWYEHEDRIWAEDFRFTLDRGQPL